MAFRWIPENPARWDAAKAAVLGAAPRGTFRLPVYAEGAPLPGEWWRVEEQGEVLGYGWMEVSWGDGEILLAVHPMAQRRGVGRFILEQLEHEASLAGLNYVHNTLEPTHPDGEHVSRWLKSHEFEEAGDGRLRRRVPVRRG